MVPIFNCIAKISKILFFHSGVLSTIRKTMMCVSFISGQRLPPVRSDFRFCQNDGNFEKAFSNSRQQCNFWFKSEKKKNVESMHCKIVLAFIFLFVFTRRPAELLFTKGHTQQCFHAMWHFTMSQMFFFRELQCHLFKGPTTLNQRQCHFAL